VNKGARFGNIENRSGKSHFWILSFKIHWDVVKSRIFDFGNGIYGKRSFQEFPQMA
jgi:hypothetical protein